MKIPMRRTGENITLMETNTASGGMSATVKTN
ncbi:hypothetical protein PC129_g14637 [Phytophthora cactorum]|uniref:Uncharacterized protein n=1 Tax=Phytophthora cactorum TaxID=29920 RepID=A0A8T1C711_9STRA|nr:hypothetical protein Pcac1_g23222 [Phytophthora cactorum]KAG2818581.1 hypothetical protein PC111_g12248 [Phytophthora cactorum]KAG2851937.1 hypothetical protein PC113_g15469 [Phytophthora cactorum]KAG2897690.1 hypothetical protein PC114_g14577 [Phytophthora cactorum]KAG2916133.1 hypothetical protein PC117_g17834 [Phytophthora cactorum]